MIDPEKDKQMQIDEMLDSMLANYSAAEPRPGLETRIPGEPARDARKANGTRMVEFQMALGRNGCGGNHCCGSADQWTASY